MEGKLLDDVSQWLHEAHIHSLTLTSPVAGVVQMFTNTSKLYKSIN